MIILGLETSCDETAAALVNDDRRVLAQRLLSQHAAHAPYGGVVPEIAARAHLDHLDTLVAGTLADAGMSLDRVDGIAATAGPGLIGGVIVGVMTAKALALAGGRPFLAVNHLEAHALTARLTDDVAFPYLLLLVSGGHCQLLAVEGVGLYRRLGTTIDDAAGECFDKTAKMMGLGHPGGPALERAARGGDPARFALPRPMRGKPGCDFSFSGLKTATRQVLDGLPPGPLSDRDLADLAASVQAAVADVLVERTARAMAVMRKPDDQFGFGWRRPDSSPPRGEAGRGESRPPLPQRLRASTPPQPSPVQGRESGQRRADDEVDRSFAANRSSGWRVVPVALTDGAAPTLVVAGGVAANRSIREALTALCGDHGWSFVAPPPALCTDNAAMVAWAGLERLRLGLTDDLDFRPRPRWPLDPDAPKRAFAGVKG